MKKTLFYSLFALAAISCQSQLEDGDAGSLRTFEFTAVSDSEITVDDATKTEFNPSTGAVSWLEGDEIAVYTTSGAKYTMTAQGSGSEVKFRGDLPAGTTTVYAVYPSSAAVSCTGGVITATLPSSQTSSPAGFQDDLVLCTAAGDVSKSTNVLQFKNVCGLVKFKVNGADVTKVKIVATSAATAITGTAAVTASTGGVSSVTKGNNVVEMVPPSGSTYFTADKVYYFAALPGTISGFTMYYECATGIKSRSTTKSMSIARSSVTVISGNDDKPGWASDAIVLSKVASTSSTVTVGWTYLGSPDPTREYNVCVFSDASCNTQIYAFTVKSAKFAGNDPRFIFTGLSSNTTYYFAVRDNVTTHYSNVVAVKTDSFTPVEVGTTSVAAGGVLLAEDFSELPYGGDCLNSACGYAPTKIANGATDVKYEVADLSTASGGNPDGFTVETAARQYTMGLQLGVAIRDDSRLSRWLYQNSNNTHNRAMCRPGYVAISNSATTPGYLITPPLSNMKSTGSITLKFKAAAYGTTTCKVGIAEPVVYVPSTGTPDYGYGAVTDGTIEVKKTLTLTSEWKEYSVTLSSVPSGARLAIGTDATASTAPLLLIDDVQVTVNSYVDKEVIPGWHTGLMDIHFLSSWTGECLFIVYPDGTTMVIDAGGDDSDTNNEEIRENWETAKSGVTAQSGTTLLCDYIRHFLDRMGKSGLDYVLLTHYHPDHMGTYHSDSYTGYTVKKTSKAVGTNSSKWTLNGITMMLENFQVGKFVDRDYSATGSQTHSYPMQLYVKKSQTLYGQTTTVYPVSSNKSQGYIGLSMMNNYRYMVRSIEDNKWTTIERYTAGSNTQFKPLYDSSYGVEVRNLGGNGVFWTGSGTSTSMKFPTADGSGTSAGKIAYIVPTDGSNIDKDGTYGYNCPAENHNSCCLRFTWGKFTFGTLGDCCYSDCDTKSWKNAEQTIANHIGQCDVMKADHHGIDGTGSSALANATSPQVWVVDNWNDSQGDSGPVSRLPSSTKMYFTNMTSVIKAELSSYMSRILSYDGHIVVRVYNDGANFKVYKLDRLDADYKVLYSSGAYTSK